MSWMRRLENRLSSLRRAITSGEYLGVVYGENVIEVYTCIRSGEGQMQGESVGAGKAERPLRAEVGKECRAKAGSDSVFKGPALC